MRSDSGSVKRRNIGIARRVCPAGPCGYSNLGEAYYFLRQFDRATWYSKRAGCPAHGVFTGLFRAAVDMLNFFPGWPGLTRTAKQVRT